MTEQTAFHRHEPPTPLVEVTRDGDCATLHWTPNGDIAATVQAVTAVVTELIDDDDPRRIQAFVQTDDYAGQRAMHRNGFRREGTHRQVRVRMAGAPVDVYSYALLRDIDRSDPANGFSAIMDTVLPKHRVIGHVLFRDERGRVLFENVLYKQDWELPGGVIEPNETPRAGARRELVEELGVELPVGPPLVIDWMPPYLGWSDAIEFIFDGGVLDSSVIDSFVLPDSEIGGYHWVEPADIPNHVTPLAARRLAALLASEQMYYSEDGRPVRFP